jgi:hypothetical protein
MQGNDCQARKILTAVTQMEVASKDTLLCVYCGHGGFDSNRAMADDSSHGHFFQIQPSGDLMRKTLMDNLLAKSARLTVLISDTCNKLAFARPEWGAADETREITAMGLSPFEELLFNYRGVIDISGTDFGQNCFCEPNVGSWFSVSAVPVLQLHSDWRGAFEQMKLVVDNAFQERRRGTPIQQEHLTPKDFRLDVYRDEAVTALTAEAPPQQKQFKFSVRRAIAP